MSNTTIRKIVNGMHYARRNLDQKHSSVARFFKYEYFHNYTDANIKLYTVGWLDVKLKLYAKLPESYGTVAGQFSLVGSISFHDGEHHVALST